MPTVMEAALEEAYASAPAGVVIYHTLELWHAEFEDVVRLVANHDDAVSSDLMLTLEASAPRNPSTSVAFTPVGFMFTEPGYDDDGPSAAQVKIDNVSGMIASIMKLTRSGNNAVDVIYRTFRSDGTSAPGQVIKGLRLKKVKITGRSATGEIGFPDVQSQAFPREVYDIDRFPGLYAQ